MATATLVLPPPEPTGSPISQPTTQQPSQTIPRRDGLFDVSGVLHGLNSVRLPVLENGRIVEKLLANGKTSVFSIDDGKTIDYGRVRFSCRGTGCEVQVINTGTSERDFNVTYKGNVSATLLPLDTGLMWDAIERGWQHQDDDAICDMREGKDCYFGNPEFNNIEDGDLYIYSFSDDVFANQSFVMGEDKSARIPSSYGFMGKRYVWAPERHGTRHCCDIIVQAGKENYRVEAIIYTNKDPVKDKSYLSYGRWMVIYYDHNKNTRWFVDVAMPEPIRHENGGPQQGLGSLSGEVTYRGGATGWYAFTGDDADAGHFTARATLNADLNSDLTSNQDLEISGTIDRFVDEDGLTRNWSVNLLRNKFIDRNSSETKFIGSGATVWTIDGTPAEADQKWSAKGWDNGNFVQGTFEAAHGAKGRMVGSYLTEKQ